MEIAVKHIKRHKIEMPKTFKQEVAFLDHKFANRVSYYKGVKSINEQMVEYNTNNFYDLLMALMFIK